MRMPRYVSPRGLLFIVTFSLLPAAMGDLAFALDDPTAPAKAKSAGRIVTVTNVKGDERDWIVALDPETSRWERITPAGPNVRLSRDGATVAFGIGTGIWTCSLEAGAKPRRIGEVGDPKAMQLVSSSPTWTPDGKSVIATGAWGELPEYTFQTYRFDLHGGAPVKVPVPKNDMIDDVSPDGRWLLMSRTRGLGSAEGLCKMRLDGSGEVRLIQGGAFCGRFSPDGTKILYSYSDIAGDEGLFLMDADGSNRRRIHPRAAFGCWSPDGKRVAFTGIPGPPVAIEEGKTPPPEDDSRFVGRVVLIDLDGTNRVVYPTPRGALAIQPDWR
jgi:Tol biopolymer transport system component